MTDAPKFAVVAVIFAIVGVLLFVYTVCLLYARGRMGFPMSILLP